MRNFNCSAPIVSMGLLEVSLGGVGVKLGPPGGLPGGVGVSMGLLEVSQGVWEAGWGCGCGCGCDVIPSSDIPGKWNAACVTELHWGPSSATLHPPFSAMSPSSGWYLGLLLRLYIQAIDPSCDLKMFGFSGDL